MTNKKYQYGVRITDGAYSLHKVGRWQPSYKSKYVRSLLPYFAKKYLLIATYCYVAVILRIEEFMGLFEITIIGSKTFYVEADTEEQALNNEIVSDEMTLITGEFEWEADTGSARLIIDAHESRIREIHNKLIVQAT